MKARCPECDALVGITPTGEKKREGWSAEHWRVDMHKHPTEQRVCDGSGKKV